MTLLREAKKVYDDRGVRSLLSAAGGHARRQIQGGTSSRPWIEKFAGVTHPLFDTYYRYTKGAGIDVLSEDWDTLILLDACRFDEFQNVCELDGQLSKKRSKGSDSVEFIRQNFVGRHAYDTVYVTANPHTHLVGEDAFHAVDDSPIGAWSEEKKCVLPETVTDVAIEAHRRYPHKRVIVHYMQPHDPPLGETAEEIRSKVELSTVSDGGDLGGGKRFMSAVAHGDIPVEIAKRAYRETIEIAMEEVRRLIDAIDGKVAISADHGELFGESYPLLGQLYEHYKHPAVPPLREVPWFETSSSSTRRNTTWEVPEQSSTGHGEEGEIEEQLAALGYK